MTTTVEYLTYKKLLVFGDEHVGKSEFKNALASSSINKFKEDYCKSPESIIMNKILVKFEKNNQSTKMTLNLFEIRLEEILPTKEMLNNLFYECQCALFFIDITSSSSMDKIKKLFDLIANENIQEKYPHVEMILVSTKSDLENGRIVSGYEVKEFLDKNKDLKQASLSLKKADEFNKLVEMIYDAQNNPNHKLTTNLIQVSQSELFSIQNNIKLVLLGDSGVGKTAMMNRHFNNEFSEVFLSTIGIDDKAELAKIRNDEYKIQIWDTAGQERFRCLPRKYYQNADGILLLFSLDSIDSFKNVDKWIKDIKQNANRIIDGSKTTSSNEKTTVVYLIGNKCDVPNEKRVVSQAEAKAIASKYNIPYVEGSCKLNLNIDEALYQVILDCYLKGTGVKDAFNLDEMSKSSQKKGCCQ